MGAVWLSRMATLWGTESLFSKLRVNCLSAGAARHCESKAMLLAVTLTVVPLGAHVPLPPSWVWSVAWLLAPGAGVLSALLESLPHAVDSNAPTTQPRAGSPLAPPRPLTATGAPAASTTSARRGGDRTVAGAGDGNRPGHGGTGGPDVVRVDRAVPLAAAARGASAPSGSGSPQG